MTDSRRCKRCGNPLASDASAETCPACMACAPLGLNTLSQSERKAAEDVTFGFEPARPGHVLETLAQSIGPMPRCPPAGDGDRRSGRDNHHPVVQRHAPAR